jgi:hypothetical protein
MPTTSRLPERARKSGDLPLQAEEVAYQQTMAVDEECVGHYYRRSESPMADVAASLIQEMARLRVDTRTTV